MILKISHTEEDDENVEMNEKNDKLQSYVNKKGRGDIDIPIDLHYSI